MTITSTLQITDGTTTVDLNGANTGGKCAFRDWAPLPPEDDEPDRVTEKARVRFWDPVLATVLTTIETLERLFVEAARWQEHKRGSRVYVKFRADSTATLYRALLFGGRVEPGREALARASLNGNTFWMELEWTRGLWEADAEVELPLLNGNASEAGVKQTGGIAIYNHDDAGAGHDNWIEIAAADVGGVVPAPVRLAITNSFASDQTFRLYLALSAYNDFDDFLHILEGEASTGGGTETEDADSSGGHYMAITWAGALEATIAKWALSADQAAACGGRTHRILARFKTLPVAGLTVRLAISLHDASPLLATSERVVLGTADELQDLGELRIPPWLTGESSLGAVDIKLLCTKASTVTTLYTTWAKTAGKTNVYEAAYTAATCVAVYNGATALAAKANTTEVDGETNSYYFDDAGNKLYVNIGGTAPTSIEVWTATIDLDYLAVMPTDSFRVLTAAGDTGTVETDTIIEDGMLEQSYVQAAGGTKTGQLSSFGAPLMLVPGREQRIYFLAANQDGESEIARTHSVRAYYRPRRLTL